MKISELEKGLKEIRERCGDVLVMATDDRCDSLTAISRLDLNESIATDRFGQKQRIAHLEILANDSEHDEDGTDEHEDQEDFSDALDELSETHAQLIKAMNLCTKTVSKHLKLLEESLGRPAKG